MMRRGVVVGLLSLAMQPMAFAGEDGIPVLALDQDGKTVALKLERAEYRNRLSTALAALEESMVEAVAAAQAGSGRAAWSLRTVIVGLGAGFELGVGPIWKLKVAPRFKLGFATGTDVVTP